MVALQRAEGVELDFVDVGSAKMKFDPEQASTEEIAGALHRIGFSAHVKK
jgi:hypothetical protein